LTPTIVASEVPPTCHPLGTNNTLVFAPGIAAGFSNADDRLPEFFYYESVPPHNVVWDFTGEEIEKFRDFFKHPDPGRVYGRGPLGATVSYLARPAEKDQKRIIFPLVGLGQDRTVPFQFVPVGVCES
jgi:hypothetical protein